MRFNLLWTVIVAISQMALVTTAVDMNKSLEQLCLENGYFVEQYTVVTDDGYVLSLYRIPGKFTEKPQTGVQKPAVLMMHCQDCDMMQWVWNSPENANAFILADAGFDVWMGNNRGSKYSQTHLTLSKKDKEYWQFYQEEMGTHDLPCFIDYILDKTGLEKISYLGHSEGTTQFFLAASLNPSYFTERVNLFVALAPVANLAYSPQVMNRFFAKHIKLIELIVVEHFHYYNWFAPMPRIVDIVGVFCDYFTNTCLKFSSLLNHHGIDNGSRFDMFISNEPSGQSYRTFVYYFQMMNSGRYALYDYGPRKNKERYGTTEAPLVPLDDYNVPTGLFTGELDTSADPADVAWLSEQLGEKVVFQRQYYLDHFSFALAKDMSWFRTDAVELLKQYNN